LFGEIEVVIIIQENKPNGITRNWLLDCKIIIDKAYGGDLRTFLTRTNLEIMVSISKLMSFHLVVP
jgi:phosphatidylserine/phosphatidylglycerophosphate/cardiolipin synthase-like enzyme